MWKMLGKLFVIVYINLHKFYIISFYAFVKLLWYSFENQNEEKEEYTCNTFPGE